MDRLKDGTETGKNRSIQISTTDSTTVLSHHGLLMVNFTLKDFIYSVRKRAFGLIGGGMDIEIRREITSMEENMEHGIFGMRMEEISKR